MEYRELFGDENYRSLLRRGADLWRLLRDHPRYAYYGTVVSLSDPGEDSAEIMYALARLQGQAMCFFYPEAESEGLLKSLHGYGLRTGKSLFFRGGEEAYVASKALLVKRAVPEGLTLVKLDANSPAPLVEATVGLCQESGLSTMPGEVMRGMVLPGVNFLAVDGKGAPVATASSYAMHAPGTPKVTEAFWGVLATRAEWRGRGLAGLLGAMAIELMWEEHGMRGFNTGIKAGNLASQAACAKLGVVRTDWVTAFCFDDARPGAA